MSIKEIKEKVNPSKGSPNTEVLPIGGEEGILTKIDKTLRPFYMLMLVLVLIGIFFGLGRLSAKQDSKQPIKVDYSGTASLISSQNVSTSTEAITETSTSTKGSVTNTMPVPSVSGEVIGSKSGKKYYFPWCGTVKRMKIENQVRFESIEKAKEAGFTPGGNCKGLY